MAPRAKSTTGIQEDAGGSLAALRELRIQRGPELRCRLAAAAPIGPLAWSPPYPMGVALKRKETNQQKQSRVRIPSLKISLHVLQD